MKEKKYVAYVGTYTHGNSKGIYIYDLDVENGRAIERKVVPKNLIMENTCILSQMKVYGLLRSCQMAIWNL